MPRQLASIQKIDSLSPIEGADMIELAHIKGWQVVVKKNEFKEGDLGVYFEIDSFLPIDPRYEFLRNSSYKVSDLLGEGFRIKTVKLRGQLSQGLLLSVKNFPEIKDPIVGSDVTEILGVRKWEIATRASSSGTIIADLPSYVPYTDEIRIQNIPEVIEEINRYEYYISVKMDGTSCSVAIDTEGQFHVFGHQYEYADDGASMFYEWVKAHHVEELLRDLWEPSTSITVQGEYCGAGIQKNTAKLREPYWFIFTVLKNGKRISLHEMKRVSNRLRIRTVPIIECGERGSFIKKHPTVEKILEFADGQYKDFDDETKDVGRREGIVIRSQTPVYSSIVSGDLSFKAVSNKYLLKNDD